MLAQLSIIIAVIKAIEDAIPEKGKGTEKLEAVRELLETTMSITTDTWPSVMKVINIVVKLFNATGVFKK
jgi:hypothetical protein